jgi:hypothetical protein
MGGILGVKRHYASTEVAAICKPIPDRPTLYGAVGKVNNKIARLRDSLSAWMGSTGTVGRKLFHF